MNFVFRTRSQNMERPRETFFPSPKSPSLSNFQKNSRSYLEYIPLPTSNPHPSIRLLPFRHSILKEKSLPAPLFPTPFPLPFNMFPTGWLLLLLLPYDWNLWYCFSSYLWDVRTVSIVSLCPLSRIKRGWTRV
uniref:Uncharacterized protein n=1 Tax=Cacopsylla melanoneura TaxID=428564 RepID=A0A8D8TNI0_9HEMI